MSEPVDHWTAPIAYHFTFTTYGTWLHGDPRGSYDRKSPLRFERYMPGDPILNEYMRRRLKFPPVELDPPARQVAHDAIEDYCKFKQWPLMALNVRTNHVHAVIRAVEDPSKMLNAIKARATRLLREAGLFEAGRPVWTERGNKGKLLTPEVVERAIHYVLHQQDRRT